MTKSLTTVDGREAQVVRGETSLPIEPVGPTLAEAMEKLNSAQKGFALAKQAATEANADKRAAQEELNLRVAEALEAHARESDLQLRLGEASLRRIHGAAAEADEEDDE